jgi:hypothetical protein
MVMPRTARGSIFALFYLRMIRDSRKCVRYVKYVDMGLERLEVFLLEASRDSHIKIRKESCNVC